MKMPEMSARGEGIRLSSIDPGQILVRPQMGGVGQTWLPNEEICLLR